VAIASLACLGAQAPALIREIPWHDAGEWLRADLHVHTRFSDGSHTVEQVAAGAAAHGCDVVAITDHSSVRLNAATPEYAAAIQRARTDNPNLTVITGLEWNVPPGTGDEHAGVLFPASDEGLDRLSAFKTRFDGFGKEGDTSSLVFEALTFLAPPDRSAVAPVVLFHHPTRRPDSPHAPTATLPRLRAAAPAIVIGFEGAPGHQRAEPLGAYDRGPAPVDRWDPIAAEIGGTWDEWLADGVDLWGAVASSDFHNESGEFWPCEFSTTWIHAPDRSPDGVIRALRAGSFFAAHGRIVTRAHLRAAIAGAPRAIVPGEAAEAAEGTAVTVTFTVAAPALDYLDRPNRIDLLEIIAVGRDGTRVAASGQPSPAHSLATTLTLPAGGLVLRARARRNLDDGTSLLAYTNPIRIATR
jgi:hypothetical protein